ncbi:MAG: DUF3037 domain-containing protein, partial [Polyangiaceae bacterium]|nr:DUF3037 domain-containing protein [Polyangiaceae bacterium]
AGVVLFCDARDFLEARIALDEARLRALAPTAEVDLARKHLEALARVCAGGPGAGPVGALPLGERWRWITAPRSTILQTSPAHTGLCHDPSREIERLERLLVIAHRGPVV